MWSATSGGTGVVMLAVAPAGQVARVQSDLDAMLDSLVGAAMNLARQPAYWLFVMLVFAGFMIVGPQQLSYLAAYPEAWFLSVLLLAVVAIPVGVIIYRFDQFEPEPASLIAVALLWGGVVALSFAAIANSSAPDVPPARACRPRRWTRGAPPWWPPSTRSSTRAPVW